MLNTVAHSCSDHSGVIPGVTMGQVDGKLFCETAKTVFI